MFKEMAQTWTRLAAEIEADQSLFQAISEMDFGEPHRAQTRAPKVHFITKLSVKEFR